MCSSSSGFSKKSSQGSDCGWSESWAHASRSSLASIRQLSAVRERRGGEEGAGALDAGEPSRLGRAGAPAAVREYSRLTMGAAPMTGGEVWTPGASASVKVGGWTWRDAATPVPTSLERGDVKGLPRHSAARARVRKEDSVRKLTLRPSATLV